MMSNCKVDEGKWSDCASFQSDDGLFAIGEEFATERANGAVAAPGGAVFASIENDLQMQGIPAGFWKNGFQIRFGLDDIFATGELPSLGEAMNVSIDWKGWHPKGLGHNYGCRFVPNTGKRFQNLKIWRDMSSVVAHENLG